MIFGTIPTSYTICLQTFTWENSWICQKVAFSDGLILNLDTL